MDREQIRVLREIKVITIIFSGIIAFPFEMYTSTLFLFSVGRGGR
jgi:hypothetical protein